MSITWQFGSESPDNSKHFGVITEWWKTLSTKEVLWKQRMTPKDGEVNWSPQKFDETFLVVETDVRGITFYRRRRPPPHKKKILAAIL